MRERDAVILFLSVCMIICIVWSWKRVFKEHKGDFTSCPPPPRSSVPDASSVSSVSSSDPLHTAMYLASSEIIRQLEPVYSYSVFPRRKFHDEFSLGYLMGFCDGIAQKININDDVELVALGTVTFLKIYGEEEGSNYFGTALSYQKKKNILFQQGIQAGGEDAFRLLSTQSRPPKKWADYLSIP